MKQKTKTIFHTVSLILSIFAITFFIGSEIEMIPAPTTEVFTAAYFNSLEATTGSITTATGTGGAGATGFWATTMGEFIAGPLAGAVAGTALSFSLYAFVLGASSRNIQAAWSTAIASTGAGIAAGLAVGGEGLALMGGALTLGPFAAAAIAAAVIFGVITMFKHKDYSQEVFKYQVGVWQPVSGDTYCEKCNDLTYGCSEYQCRSYGQDCELINPNTEVQRCVKSIEDGINPPTVGFNDSELTDGYDFTPGQYGVHLNHNGKCLKPFVGVEFSITTETFAQCRWGLEREEDFESYPYQANNGATFNVKNHKISLLGENFPTNYELSSNGYQPANQFQIFILCKGRNGVVSTSPYSVEFCIDDGPDITPPKVVAENPMSGAFLRSGTLALPVQIFTDEAANCSWDYIDKPYSQMQNNFTHCIQSVDEEVLPNLKCHESTFDALKEGPNKFYVRCMDKPFFNKTETPEEKRVENQNSHLITYTVSKPILIDKVLINSSESGAKFKSNSGLNLILEAHTSQGADGDGAARCFYNNNEFYNGGSIKYSNKNYHTFFARSSGIYNLNIKCCDKAGNCAQESLSFELEIDSTPASISRAYYEGGQMVIVTSEKSTCSYSIGSKSFLFEDGTLFSTMGGLEHSTSWDTESNLYVKCVDEAGNRPSEPQIILRASDLYS